MKAQERQLAKLKLQLLNLERSKVSYQTGRFRGLAKIQLKKKRGKK